MNWNGWPIERISILVISLAFLMIFIQVTMSHYRQNFHHKAMWIPILASPMSFLAGIGITFYHAPWITSLFIGCMWLGIVDGLIGFYFHFRGVGVRVGGWAIRNFLIGPPVMLPLMFTIVSGLGLLTMYWK